MEHCEGTNRKIKFKSSNFSREVTLNEVNTSDECKTANEFNSFFANMSEE